MREVTPRRIVRSTESVQFGAHLCREIQAVLLMASTVQERTTELEVGQTTQNEKMVCCIRLMDVSRL